MEIEINDNDVLRSLKRRADAYPNGLTKIGGVVYTLRQVYNKSLKDPTFSQTAVQELATRYLNAALIEAGA